MASLHCVVHCFLLMFITSSVSQRECSTNFNCPSLVNVKVGDSVQLICKASCDIWNVIVHDPGNEVVINTYESKNVSADKRIILQIGKASPPYKSSAALHISSVNISDAGTYAVFLLADGGYDELKIELRVEVPYSNISMTQNKNAVVCEAQGGSFEGQIHWFDGHRGNWTKSAEMISKKMENGRFMLTSVLHLKPLSIMEMYCCTIVYRLMGNTEEMSSCVSTNGTPQGQGSDEESRKTYWIILIPIVLMVFAALMIYRRSGKRHVKQGQRLSEIVQSEPDEELETSSKENCDFPS